MSNTHYWDVCLSRESDGRWLITDYGQGQKTALAALTVFLDKDLDQINALEDDVGWTTTGAEVGTMATGLAAVTATALWVRNRAVEWTAARNARKSRNWNGYIIREGVGTWFVRLVEDDTSEKWSEKVTLEVVDQDGTPNPSMAHALRLFVQSDGMISRSPTPAQWEFLQDLRKARFGAPGGYPLTE